MTVSRIYSSKSKTYQDPNEIDWRKLRDDAEGADNLGDHEIHKTSEEEAVAFMKAVEDGTIDTSKIVKQVLQRIDDNTKQVEGPCAPRLSDPQSADKPSIYSDDIDNYEELEPDEDAQIEAEIAAAVKSERTLILSPGSPCASAREFSERLDAPMRYWRGDFYGWCGTHYEAIENDEIRARLYRFLETAKLADGKRFNPTSKKVSDVIDALKAEALLFSAHEPDSDRDIVAFKNGLLRLSTEQIEPHNPKRFSLYCLPFDYNPHLPEPTEWLNFLKSLWPDRNDYADLLQEVFGYYISGRTDLQKIFLLLGPPRSGKGTIAHVLRGLVGERHVCGMTLDRFGKDFGMAGLVDKTAMIIPDMREGRRIDLGVVTERLLNISGEDPISIARKYLDDWRGMLRCRVMIMSNEIPRLPDGTGTIASRFVPVKMFNSFLGCEDTNLKPKLTRELPEIMNWALTGLRRLNERGYFVIPEDDDIIEEVLNAATPIVEFIEDYLIVEPTAETFKARVYDAYKMFAVLRGYKVMNDNHFSRQLKGFIPGLKPIRHRVNGKPGPRMWMGIRLADVDQQVLSRWDDSDGEPEVYVPDNSLSDYVH
jgi:putative DNA primase/helicase